MALVFLKFIVFLNLIVFSTSEETCEKKDVCSCTFKNGSTVDLRPVDETDGDPRYENFHFNFSTLLLHRSAKHDP